MKKSRSDMPVAGRTDIRYRAGALSRWAGRTVLVAPLTFAALCCAACPSERSRAPEQSGEVAAEGHVVQPATAAKALSPEPLSTPTETPQAALPAASQTTTPPTVDWKKELTTLPESVLVGTDVTPLADFLGSVGRIPSNGTFRSEQGGAVAHVQLASGPKGQTLSRSFAEPGTKAQTKRYEGLRSQADGVRLSGKDLEVIGMGHSLLVLEKRSGIEGIPESLWIEYESAPSSSGASGGAK